MKGTTPDEDERRSGRRIGRVRIQSELGVREKEHHWQSEGLYKCSPLSV